MKYLSVQNDLIRCPFPCEHSAAPHSVDQDSLCHTSKTINSKFVVTREEAETSFNLFHVTGLFLPLVFCCFQEVLKETSGIKWDNIQFNYHRKYFTDSNVLSLS